MNQRKLTVLESACIITGCGMGGGVMAIPYLASKTSFAVFLIVLIAAYVFSWFMHMMIAECVAGCGTGTQIISIFSKYLFKGKAKKPLTILFFVLMSLALIFLLSSYIIGAGEIMIELLPIHPVLCQIIVYVAAASVVFFGLKVLGVAEKYAIFVIFALIIVLACASLSHMSGALPHLTGSFSSILALYSMVMFSLTAFFSVPQVVEGLTGDMKKIRKAITIGIANNMILILIISFFSFYVSPTVTEVAMVGWAEGLGNWAGLIGNLFTLLAMLTSFWACSMGLSDMIKEVLNLDYRLSWLLATIPSVLLAILTSVSFINSLQVAGGAIGLIIAILVIPTYRLSMKDASLRENANFNHTFLHILLIIGYLGMAIGSLF